MPTLEAMPKMIFFIMAKIFVCKSLVVLYQTWPTFAYTNILMQNSILSRKEIKTFWKKNEKILLVVHLSFLHAKQLLKKISFESLQTYANRLLELYNPTQCVNPCPPVFIRVGISIQKRVDSHLEKTRPAALKIWSCPISNGQDQNVKLKASLQRADGRKLTASVLMGFVLIATLYLKPWDAFTTSVPVKSCVLLSLKRIFNAVAKRESLMRWDDTICKRKASRLLKCGSANGGDCTKQPILLSNISESTFLTGVHLHLSYF